MGVLCLATVTFSNGCSEMKTNENLNTLFVNQEPEVVEQFRSWLIGTGVRCVVVEPIARAFSLVVRDDPWGVVLRIDEPVGEKLCAQIREDDLLEELKIIALSRGANSSQLTEHMFGSASADVYGKLPLEDGIVDVWLRNQIGVSDESSGNEQGSEPLSPDFQIEFGEEEDEVEIELTADLSVSSIGKTTRPDSTVDERISETGMELFEQTEKMTLINRNCCEANLHCKKVHLKMKCCNQNVTVCLLKYYLLTRMRHFAMSSSV